MVLSAESPQGAEVVVPCDGRDDGSLLVAGDVFSVHHGSCEPPVAVVEGVDLGDEKCGEGAALGRGGEGVEDVVAAAQGPFYEVGGDEYGVAGLIGLGLELAGVFVVARFEDDPVPALELVGRVLSSSARGLDARWTPAPRAMSPSTAAGPLRETISRPGRLSRPSRDEAMNR